MMDDFCFEHLLRTYSLSEHAFFHFKTEFIDCFEYHISNRDVYEIGYYDLFTSYKNWYWQKPVEHQCDTLVQMALSYALEKTHDYLNFETCDFEKTRALIIVELHDAMKNDGFLNQYVKGSLINQALQQQKKPKKKNKRKRPRKKSITIAKNTSKRTFDYLGI